jgi:hypothetical protein
LNATHDISPIGPCAVWCDLIAHAGVQAPVASMAELRRQPGPPRVPKLPTNFLKHVDDQTVVGLSAIYHASAGHGLQDVCLAEWGVLAAPRFLARALMIPNLRRFVAEGAWGVSPHMIPHRSLHSLSGTLSHALKMHGPNFGVGGGHQGAIEVLPVAAAMLQRQRLPGLWVVWTAQEPEGELDLAGRGDPNTICRALAVALTLPRLGWRGPRLRLQVGGSQLNAEPEKADYFYLETILNRLGRDPGTKVGLELGSGIRIDLEIASGSNHGTSAVHHSTTTEIEP